MNLLILTMIATLLKGGFSVSSPAFKNNSDIPQKYTCQGENINPALVIKGIPEDTKSLVLIMDDPDAPGTFDHWVMWNITPAEIIAENSSPGEEGKNGKGDKKYMGPCPPKGKHHYHFKVYALNTMLDLPQNSNKKDVEKAMNSHVIAEADLVGLYEKK